MINVGIIGFGKMGHTRYQAINENSQGCVVAVADPYVDVDLSDVHVYTQYEDIILDSDIEAVFICAPNKFNKPLTIQALQAGKHVFCEKPPAFTASEVEEIRIVEKATGCKLMYGFNHRHHGSVRKAKEVLDSGVYGRLLWMRGRYGKSVDQDFYKEWRSNPELAGGGILLDQGIHMLDLFLMFAGHFDEVHAFVSNLYWHLDVEDNVFAIFRNQDGVVASLHSTMTQWRHLFALEIFLERGYIVLNGLLTSSHTYGEEVLVVAKNRTTAPAATWEDEDRYHFSADKSWQVEITHFFEAITNGTPIALGTSADALALMHLVDKIYACGHDTNDPT